MFSPEQSAQIQVWRRQANDGTITVEELRKALELLRQGRAGAHATSAASRTRKATAAKVVNSDDLLKELGDL